MKQTETDNRTEKRKTGDLGENMACKFLVKRGFEIVERNHLQKWGEIDIIVKKDGKLHFIEVKTVSRPHQNAFGQAHDWYRPEDNLHPWKLKRLSRVIQTYLLGYRPASAKSYGVARGKGMSADEEDWQFDVITVYLNLKTMEAKIDYLEDIIL